MNQAQDLRSSTATVQLRAGAGLLLALCIGACGGGGGGGGGGQQVAVDDADALTQAVDVALGDSLADKVAGSPPAPSGSEGVDAPLVSADVSATEVEAGDDVSVPLTVRSASQIERLFAKIPGAASYFEVAVSTGGKRMAAAAARAKAQRIAKALTQTFQFSVKVPGSVENGRFCIQFSAQDVDGRVSNVAEVCLDVVDQAQPSANQPPDASAGADQRVLPGTAVTLDGSASGDADSTTLSYAWAQVQGPAVALQNANAAVATFDAPDTDGVTLSFVLTVTDDQGASGSAAATVVVSTQPPPTVVSFAAAAQSALESAGTVNVVLSVVPTPTEDITLPFTVSGTASGNDRTVASSPLTIPAGATSASIAVTISDDATAEDDETVVLTLGTPTGAELGSPSVHTLTIVDNEGTPVPPGTLFVVDEAYRLIRFQAASPQTITTVDITGVEATGGDGTRPLPLALDFRPANGDLFLATDDRRFYRIDTSSGAATLAGTTVAADVATPLLLGIDFDPCADRIRAIGINQENYRLNPDASLVARDTDLQFASGDAYAGFGPDAVNGIAYSACEQGATTLYGIDTTLDLLVRIGSAGGSPTSPNSGQVSSIAELSTPVGGAGQIPFDIDAASGAAYLLNSDGVDTTVYEVDLTTGELTNLGIIGDGSADLRANALAVQP
ncbi:MAG: DUF4394 domain-containing protein [Sinimarinibacterium sp.]